MPAPAPPAAPHKGLSLPLRAAALSRRAPHAFDLRPDAAARARLAADLGIAALPALAFAGRLSPEGREDWRLEGELRATAVQACVVTGAPVTTRIAAPVLRRYLAGWIEPEAAEAEIPEDDSAEALPAVIDPGAAMREALSLSLPDYPRSPDAPPPGAPPPPAAGGAARPNPFAALAALKPARSPGDDSV